MRRSSLIARLALALVLADSALLPSFVFPEEDDAYFGANVASIKKAVREALDDGCLDSWPLEGPSEIAVVFRHDSMVPETSNFYIQYQMEQVAASRAAETSVGFRSFADHLQYKKRLAGALQVWEWSPHQMDFLKTAMPNNFYKKLAYVPLPGGLDQSNACDSILDEPWCQQDDPPDVLFFGFLSESRKQLCKLVDEQMDRLNRAGHSFSHQCVMNTYGDALQCKVCKARVVYSDHSREGAVLELHRINPLLAQGKAVVSAKSADKTLDDMYGSAVTLVERGDIPKAISKLLLDETRRMEMEWRSYALSQELQRKAQPQLCKVVRSLAALASEDSQSRGMHGLQEYVPHYVFDRKLSANNNGSSNATRTARLPEQHEGQLPELSFPPPSPPPSSTASPPPSSSPSSPSSPPPSSPITTPIPSTIATTITTPSPPPSSSPSSTTPPPSPPPSSSTTPPPSPPPSSTPSPPPSSPPSSPTPDTFVPTTTPFAPSPTPVTSSFPTPVPSPTPTPVAPVPSPTPSLPPPTPTPTPTPVAPTRNVPTPTPAPTRPDEEENGSIQMCQVFVATACVGLAWLIMM